MDILEEAGMSEADAVIATTGSDAVNLMVMLQAKEKGVKYMASIVNEASNGISNARGTIAMARTSDPNSATDQFFINLKDNKFLDKASDPNSVGYAVFGKVKSGMDVVDKIAAVKTARTSVSEGQPVENVVIESMTMQSTPSH